MIESYEKFASLGGMMPEQVWDHDDIPSAGMYLGKPAGSAQPLVWAHAEYLKLLRSVVDGKIFDTISAVAERYAVAPGKRTFRCTVEIFQIARPLSQVPAGSTLRIINADRFNVVFTQDGWATSQTVSSRSCGYPGSYVDIPTQAAQSGPSRYLSFTMHWPERAGVAEHWLGHNVDIEVASTPPPVMPPSTAPVS